MTNSRYITIDQIKLQVTMVSLQTVRVLCTIECKSKYALVYIDAKYCRFLWTTLSLQGIKLPLHWSRFLQRFRCLPLTTKEVSWYNPVSYELVHLLHVLLTRIRRDWDFWYLVCIENSFRPSLQSCI